MEQNKILPIVVVVALGGLGMFGLPKLEDRIADKVIQKLQKSYSPGPYAPGLDPDKVNPNVLRQPQVQPQQVVPRQPLPTTPSWGEAWENSRR